MSRIGKKPISVPGNVTVSVDSTNVVTVKGPKGTLTERIPAEMTVAINDGTVEVGRPSDSRQHKAYHGLSRTLIANMVEGVTNGFQKVLEMNGTGYRAAKDGKILVLSLGFSHPVRVEPYESVELEVGERNSIIIKGPNKQKVGDQAANIRKLRPPEPYLGKGIKYQDEVIRRKAGKAGKK
ncbi:MAG: 50S ribosomal protein L6 [Herpetosiphonaceae bacterium]|nr:50S ribosomal protein L6 [Herpetosiphonaceae bacterium]